MHKVEQSTGKGGKRYCRVEAGLLPLRHRFIRITLDDTIWIIRASKILSLTTAYYEKAGWREPDDLEPGEKQPCGRELRGIVEVNGDLAHHAKESRWSEVASSAKLIAGPDVTPPGNDELWWFEEQGGEVEEVTDLPIARQTPRHTLWFSKPWADAHGVEVSHA